MKSPPLLGSAKVRERDSLPAQGNKGQNMKNRWMRWALIATMGAVVLPAMASAQEERPPSGDVIADDGYRAREDTYETARGIAMGSGTRASAAGTNAAAYNPANLPLMRNYHLEATAGYLPRAGAFSIGAVVADSVSNRLGAAFSFRGVLGNGDRDYRGYDARLSLGMPFSDQIAVGISGRYMNLSSRAQNSNGDTVGPEVSAFTVDAAIRVTPVQGLHIAALGYNLINTDSSLAPVLLGGSVSYAYENLLTLGGDIFVDMTTFEDPQLIFGVGGEVLVGGQVPIRAGYRRDQGRSANQLTLGLGYADPRFGVDISLRQDIGGEKVTEIVAGVRYHVQ